MMNYKKEKTSFKFNYVAILLGVLILVEFYMVYKKESTLYRLKENPNFIVGEAPERICYWAVQDFIKGEAYSQYFSPELWDYLKDNKTIFDFESDDKILEFKFRDKICKVIVESQTGIRALDVTMELSMANPLLYMIVNVRDSDSEHMVLTNKE